MKIAVTYENGQIFQHFGHTPGFKVYYVEDGKVTRTEEVAVEGEGHGAISGQLGAMGVDTVICGGLGDGMLNGLKSHGITVCANVSGDADSAVEKYLNGTLEYSENLSNCDHHHKEEAEKAEPAENAEEAEEECGCGGGCGGGCSGGCGGGCGGGCHSFQFDHEPVGNEGKKCKVHYTGTFNDGTKFDSSYDRGEPLAFTCGVGQMIKGFDKAVIDMKVGDVKDIHLMPEEAYGMPDPAYIVKFAIAELEGSRELEVGQKVYLQDMYGNPIPVKVIGKDENDIIFDANHEMAGKELNFHIELVEVED